MRRSRVECCTNEYSQKWGGMYHPKLRYNMDEVGLEFCRSAEESSWFSPEEVGKAKNPQLAVGSGHASGSKRYCTLILCHSCVVTDLTT